MEGLMQNMPQFERSRAWLPDLALSLGLNGRRLPATLVCRAVTKWSQWGCLNEHLGRWVYVPPWDPK